MSAVTLCLRSATSSYLAEKYSLNQSVDKLGEQEELTVDFSKYSA